ncbi:hypothetical protein [Luteimonas sp. A534]
MNEFSQRKRISPRGSCNPHIATHEEVRAWAKWQLLRANRLEGFVDERREVSIAGRPTIAAKRKSAPSSLGEPEGDAHVSSSDKYSQTRLQAELADWLGQGHFNVMITLTFDSADGVSLALATKLFGKFLQRLAPIVLRKGIRNGRVPMVPIIEDSKEQLRELGLTMEGREGTHLHVLMRLRGDDPYKYKDAIKEAWKVTGRLCGDPKIYCPDSDQWFLPLTSGALRKTYVGYVLKQQATDTLGLLVKYLHLD